MVHEQTPLVIVFTTSYLPLIGGAEVAIDEITERIPNMRFLILTSRYSRRTPKREVLGSNVEINRLGPGFSFDKWLLPFLAFSAARRAIKGEQRACLWGVMISQATLGAYMIKRFYPSVRFVVTLQEGDSVSHIKKARFGLIGYFWKRVLARADYVTAISRYLQRMAEAHGYTKEVSLIPNGVDEKFVSMSHEKPPRSLREELGIADDAKVITSVSRLVPKNGIESLIRAFSMLKSELSSIKLLLVGDGKSRKKLERLARDLGISHDVIFTGVLPHSHVLEYYRISDAFVRPSLSEGLGSVFLEAMGAGVPVIATAVGGIVDIVEDGETGVFVKEGDPLSIRDGIYRVLTNERLKERLIKNGRQLVVNSYLWVDIARSMQDTFKKQFSR